MTLKIIVKGIAKGKIMKTNIPINFLGAVDKKTGVIRDDKHDMFQRSFLTELEVVLELTQFIL
jgi:predicted aconitase with swiveling domain